MNKYSQLKLVSVIVPAKDESESIGSLISKIKGSLSEYPYEIIIVDDGSEDGTGEIARDNGTIVVSTGKNLGKGTAMKIGVDNASGDVIVFLDGDGAHDPKDILRVMAPILEGKASLVIGSRALTESKVVVFPITRKLSNNLASFIISVIISFLLPLATSFRYSMKRQKINDCTSGFRAIKSEVWQKFTLVSQGFQIETEMIYEAARNGVTIVEVPISCNWNREFSRLSICSDGLKTLKLLAGKLLDDLRKGRDRNT